MKKILSIIIILTLLFACEKDSENNSPAGTTSSTDYNKLYPAISQKFAGKIDLNSLDNYANQSRPSYVVKDNTGSNLLTDKGATLGRVLFYDKELSIDRSISCGSCHKQSHAFGDPNIQSDGVMGGKTGRHSMRLVNARFGEELRFFWDKRANTLEEQTTEPIQDHAEMGFSGLNGNPDLNDLISRLQALDHYREFFDFVYGDETVNEDRIQKALAQFVRSIESFDSKFDEGLIQAGALNQDFPNYTAEENLGKTLFLNAPQQGGAGCRGCHRAPEFDINPIGGNNGIIATIGSSSLDLNVTRAPSLRDLVNNNGGSNGPLMHDGSKASLADVVEHYNRIPFNPANTNLDPRFRGPGGLGGPPQGQDLQLSTAEKAALVAFLETLSGENLYTDTKWASPF